MARGGEGREGQRGGEGADERKKESQRKWKEEIFIRGSQGNFPLPRNNVTPPLRPTLIWTGESSLACDSQVKFLLFIKLQPHSSTTPPIRHISSPLYRLLPARQSTTFYHPVQRNGETESRPTQGPIPPSTSASPAWRCCRFPSGTTTCWRALCAAAPPPARSAHRR